MHLLLQLVVKIKIACVVMYRVSIVNVRTVPVCALVIHLSPSVASCSTSSSATLSAVQSWTVGHYAHNCISVPVTATPTLKAHTACHVPCMV